MNDNEFIAGFSAQVKSESNQKSSTLIPLNEAVYSMEGFLNFNKCDAKKTKFIEENSFALELEYLNIDDNGEVWVEWEVIESFLNNLDDLIEVRSTDKISFIDLDVRSISNAVITIYITVSRSEKLVNNLDFSWFLPSESYKAMGNHIISNPYQAEALYNYSLQPGHIGYPSQPYPAWIHINDKLNRYFDILDYGMSNGQWGLYLSEKVWYTNIQTAYYDHLSMDPSIAECPYGRMDIVYMAGSTNSGWFVTSGASCGCSSAPVPVFGAETCGNYTEVVSALADETINSTRLNNQLAFAIDFIENKHDELVAMGIPNAGIANVQYFGIVIPGPGLYTTSDTQVRYHACKISGGTKNVSP